MKESLITSPIQLAQAVDYYGLLPFFDSPVPELSVAALAGDYLFDDDDGGYGCWDWKGPVIREKQCAYGKFFRRKAGFVSLPLLPHFLNFRRATRHIHAGSGEEMILDIIRTVGEISSTELRSYIFEGVPKESRHSLEAPLQRLQMAGRILISDFNYKLTRSGKPYGWGVATYSTPEYHFHGEVSPATCSPKESRSILRAQILRRIPGARGVEVDSLLK